MSHTAGPWQMDGDEIITAEGEQICQVRRWDEKQDAEWEANMRVLAVSPKMLDALKRILDYWTVTGFAECDPDCDCIVEDVRAAIAEAEGRQA